MNAIVEAPTPTLQQTLATPLIYWHLLSLDAPTVAALWTLFVARTAHIRLPLVSIAAMFLAVWILYAADRLLDTRTLHTPHLEARHHFHHTHRGLFGTGIIVSSLLLAPLLLTIPPEAIRLYLTAGALLFAWFILIHATPTPRRLPKEIAVGVFFSAAIFISTVARAPQLRLTLLPSALLFAALCSLNCLYIYAWEHPTPSMTAHPTTLFALRHLSLIAPTLTAVSFAIALVTRTALPAAIALSASLLLTLNRSRPHSPTFLRAAADLALLTPILFLPFPR